MGIPAGVGGLHLQLGPLSLLGTVESLLEARRHLLIRVTSLLSGQSDVQPGLGILGQKWEERASGCCPLHPASPGRHTTPGSQENGSPGKEMPAMPTTRVAEP